MIVLEQILVIGLELSERRPGQILKRTAVSFQAPSGLLAREGCCPPAGSWEQGAASPSLGGSSESWGLAFLIHQIAALKVSVSSSSSQDPHFVIDCQDFVQIFFIDLIKLNLEPKFWQSFLQL